MDTRVNLAAALPLAVTAAGAFAISAVLQQRAARQAPESKSLSPRLLLDLVRRSGWLLGIGCLTFAYLLQAAALAFSDVSLVQPLIILELAFALPLAMRIGRQRAGIREWLGVSCVILGVGAFVGLAGSNNGNPEPAIATWALVAGPAAAVVIAMIVLARGPETPKRAALLAVAAGVINGLLALLTKSMVTLLGQGIGAVLSSWQLYSVIGCGVLGLLVAQSAFQAAPLALSLPIIDALEPTVAVSLAAIAFGDHLASSVVGLAAEMLGGLLALVGIFVLGHSPLVLSIYEQTEEQKSRAPRS
jgi:drug/metabolite transporter (DMT)-like permease